MQKSTIDQLTDEIELDSADLPLVSRKDSQPSSKSKTRKSRRVYDRHFICGPIPLDWICAAQSLGGAALFVGLALWHFAGMNDGSLKARAGWRNLTLNCVSISTVKRALAILERAGLIRVTRASGKKNVIEIVDEPRNTVRSEQPSQSGQETLEG